jgi:polar amino acid transport system ATP-binding protein
MSNTPVTIHGLKKSFADHVVLDGLSFTIANNQRLAILGPSGGGKTTLLRVICALEQPDAGEVRIGEDRLWGDQVTSVEHERSRLHVGLVFQQFHLFPHLRVIDNCTLAPRLVRGLSRAAAEAAAMTWLDRVGLKEKATAWPATLSGGQRQRVAIARALCMQPNVLCFDEPTSALDPELVGEVVSVVQDLATSVDTTMILVTHQIGFARAVADRVVVLADGQLVEDGTPEQVFDSPTHERTKRFLGAITS